MAQEDKKDGSEFFPVLCHSCGGQLGRYLAIDDHSGIVVQCPHCGVDCYISNNALSSPEKFVGGKMRSSPWK